MGATADRRGRSLSRAVAAAGLLAVVGGPLFAGTAATEAWAADGAATTESAVTLAMDEVHPDAPSYLRGLTVSVSQTRGLSNQAVRISWGGWRPTTEQLSGANGNYFMQVMQCWGTDPADPSRPDPTTCQYGDESTAMGSRGSRRIPGLRAMDFRSVTGTALGLTSSTDHRYGANEFWNAQTQNALSGVRTGGDGTGQVLFEVLTGAEAPGLGCGDRLVGADGTVTGRPCWLMVVPRGPVRGAEVEQNATLSPFSSGVWDWGLAVPLDFVPAGQACEIGRAETRLAGTELLTDASLSWQRELCREGDVFVYAQTSEPLVRRQIVAGGGSAAAAAVTVRPFDSAAIDVDAERGVDYAPLTLSGLVIGYRIDHQLLAGDGLQGTPVTGIRLSPRLVAKMLTMSYRSELGQAASDKGVQQPNGTRWFGFVPAPGYGWAERNPTSVWTDPEFRRLNPELATLPWTGGMSGLGTHLKLTLDASDGAAALWSWVTSDVSARTWLAGIPDEDGMRVNPYYTTNADASATGSAFELPRDTFPLADPWCDIAGTRFREIFPGAEDQTWSNQTDLCAPDRVAYVADWHTGARHTLKGTDPRKDFWDTNASPAVWKQTPRLAIGKQLGFTVTDAASATRYGLDTAILCNADGSRCSAPTTAAFQAAVPAMTAVGGTRLRQLDPTADLPSGAYPLTLLSYVAVPYGDFDGDGTEDRDPETRGALSRYVEFAATRGQDLGTAYGDLPPGYAPLPAGLRAEATDVAHVIAIRGGAAPTPIPTPPGGTAQFAVPGGVLPGTGDASDDSASGDPSTGGPRAAGVASGPLLGGATPADPSRAQGWLVPGLVGLGLAAGLGVPLLGRLKTGGGAS